MVRNDGLTLFCMGWCTDSWAESIAYQMTKMSAADAVVRLSGPIALAKAHATLNFEYCAREASQILGGIAYTRGGRGEKVERLYR